MNHIRFSAHTPAPRFRPGGLLLAACAGLTLLAGPLGAAPMPKNLGNGLDALVESNLKLKADPSFSPHKLKKFKGFATQRAAYTATSMIQDPAGRILVRVHPDGRVPLADLQKTALAAAPSMTVQAVNATFQGVGVFEAYISVDEVTALARLKGVSAVKLSLKPFQSRKRFNTLPGQPAATVGEHLNAIGTVYDYGVIQHRVDQIDALYNPAAALDYEGRGISIGVISDSYDSSGATIDAATDVSTGDLPGTGNTLNTQPVVVLHDIPAGQGGTDEGRGMLQTVYKMAPKARLAFASGDYGEVDFANNIFALAGFFPGYYDPSVQDGFAADIIADDLTYLDEPFFQDGIVAQAAQIVSENGVSYFSSAGNNPGTNGYDSDFRFVDNTSTALTAAAGNAALANTNINLANVPTALYAGGFHNFNPSGLDVAQTVNYPDAAFLQTVFHSTDPIYTILQWNDPDGALPTITGTVVEDTGTLTYNPSTQTANTASFPVNLTAGQTYEILETPGSNPATPGLLPLDGIVTLADPSGNVLSTTDNGSDGEAERVLFAAPVTGTYTVSVDAFEDPADNYVTDGSFTLDVYATAGLGGVTQDLNLLVFDMNGNYLSSSSGTANNLATNSPIEVVPIVAPPGATQVQFVISRTGPPPATGRTANHLRYIAFGDGISPLGPAEYFSYLTPTTYGHDCADGAINVAAYPYYRPSTPENDSVGPATVYFDANANPLPAPQVRLKPDVAAMDGANTTFFGGGDSREDLDTNPNFFGTSDAAPHAAAIAALVLEANGGSGSVTPAQMKTVLQSSAFVHDLDPFSATGTARTSAGGKVTVTINSDDETTLDGVPGTEGSSDPNSIAINYIGAGSLATFVFNPAGTPATAGDPTGGNNGLDANGTYFDNSTPGLAFSPDTPFTLGSGSGGFTTSNVTATSANPVTQPPNGVSIGLYFTQQLAFDPGVFTGGKVLRFTVGRYQYQFSDVTTAGGRSLPNVSADLFGGGVSLPNGVQFNNGMSFSGTTTSGATFSGVIKNRLGAGYSVLDGFGFINAEAAVQTPLP